MKIHSMNACFAVCAPAKKSKQLFIIFCICKIIFMNLFYYQINADKRSIFYEI